LFYVTRRTGGPLPVHHIGKTRIGYKGKNIRKVEQGKISAVRFKTNQVLHLAVHAENPQRLDKPVEKQQPAKVFKKRNCLHAKHKFGKKHMLFLFRKTFSKPHAPEIMVAKKQTKEAIAA
jgi:hypothetical protein